VPLRHFERLRDAVRAARASDPVARPVVELVVAGGHHSWLYEFEEYRRTVARFLAEALGGPLSPAQAADRAAAVAAARLPDPEQRFHAITDGSGVRRLARVALPGATRPDPSIAAPLAAPSTDPPLGLADAAVEPGA